MNGDIIFLFKYQDTIFKVTFVQIRDYLKVHLTVLMT